LGSKDGGKERRKRDDLEKKLREKLQQKKREDESAERKLLIDQLNCVENSDGKGGRVGATWGGGRP